MLIRNQAGQGCLRAEIYRRDLATFLFADGGEAVADGAGDPLNVATKDFTVLANASNCCFASAGEIFFIPAGTSKSVRSGLS